MYGDVDAYEIKLMDGNYIYEVHAYFPESGSGYGDAYYGFYTEKFPQESGKSINAEGLNGKTRLEN